MKTKNVRYWFSKMTTWGAFWRTGRFTTQESKQQWQGGKKETHLFTKSSTSALTYQFTATMFVFYWCNKLQLRRENNCVASWGFFGPKAASSAIHGDNSWYVTRLCFYNIKPWHWQWLPVLLMDFLSHSKDKYRRCSRIRRDKWQKTARSDVNLIYFSQTDNFQTRSDTADSTLPDTFCWYSHNKSTRYSSVCISCVHHWQKCRLGRHTAAAGDRNCVTANWWPHGNSDSRGQSRQRQKELRCRSYNFGIP